ncbi:DUF418 domain-containing protein [Labedella endophytica]|uniref:DUF418 domain-containing protein n=2 Tax=Labedella endophytica TaxID=1523160 RepID=A0A3S0X8P7_9MICO|nr:DUF418 domain-containing protein [Labedella endophytica]
MMLLLIALAHVPYFLYVAPVGAVGLHPVDGGLADRIAQAVTLIVVDARVYTMFGFLFAYGIGQMYARQVRSGAEPADARRLLRRRHLWMIVFGAVHGILLWQGDIIGAYGVIGLVLMPLFFRRSDKTLVVWIVVLLAVGAAVAALNAVSYGLGLVPEAMASDLQRLSIAEPNYLLAALARIPAWFAVVFGSFVGLALPTAFLAGNLASRRRILDEPSRHLPLLRRLAFWGILLGWGTGVVLALQHTGVVEIAPDGTLVNVHLFAGTFAGIGYAALFGLIAHRLSVRSAITIAPVRWIGALGRRSMSGYLFQSLAWGPVLAAWGLGLGAHLSSWSVALYAVLVWAITVALAAVMESRGIRGPAETLLRRLMYGARKRT